METLRDDGHLTEQALRRLVGGGLSELERLELAEHLSYCDDCLLRYTALLDGDALLAPSPQCRERLWQRLRRRTLHLVVNRFAAAAAAVAVMLTALWGSGLSSNAVFFAPAAEPSALAETLRDWPQKLESSVSKPLNGLERIFDYFGGGDTVAAQGGN